MGSQIAVWLDVVDVETAVALLTQAEALFLAVESRLSRFRAESELSRLNAQPQTWVPVSNLLWQVVTQALSLAQETDGLFDPTILRALITAGYDRSFTELTGQHGRILPATAVPQPNQWRTVRLNSQQRAIWLPDGVQLDLGGLAKGYTAQQVVNFLTNWGPCLVDAGGDLTAGDAPSGWPGWPVGVSAPYPAEQAPRATVMELWLVNSSLATSGIDYRRWQVNGRPAHHLIDPRTGAPAQTDLLVTSVLAGTAVRAEAWATASLIAGTETAVPTLTAQNMAAALISQTGELLLTPAMNVYLPQP